MWHERGRLLAGGAPFRIIRLTEPGGDLVATWKQGARLGPGRSERRLARRLLDAGLLDPDPDPRGDLSDLSVVVPVRDTPSQLDRCLSALRSLDAELELIVVDDGSQDAAAIAAVAAAHRARLLRRPQSGGPATARNTGLAAAATKPLIAFIDADVVVEPDALQRLLAHFDDPAVAGAAPRIRALKSGGVIGGYESVHSSLDRGPRPGPVAPHTAVPFVPSATLVLRRSALAAAGGFNAELIVGEDVDLVWRLATEGLRVDYDPAAQVRHDHRLQALSFLRRRWQYASSIGLLARRHPTSFQAVQTDPVTTLFFAACLLRRPRAAVALLALRTALVARLIGRRGPAAPWLVTEIMRRLLWGTLQGFSYATRALWSPAFLLDRRLRRLLVLAYLIRLCESDGPRTPAHLGLGIVDDLVAATATIVSCAQHRTLAPLRVVFTNPGFPKLRFPKLNPR